jgi:beta-lactam-binding protein with PASTA domain
MKLMRFLRTKAFWANMALAVIVVLISYQGLKAFLSWHTYHGDSWEVPDITGLHMEDARKVLEEKQLRLRVTDSSEFNFAFNGHEVYQQYPIPGAMVKRDRPIRVTVNPMKEPPILLPDVREVKVERALEILKRRGFKIGKTTYIPYLGKDVVVRLESGGAIVEPGMEFKRGAYIDVVLGEGLGEEVLSVPSLIGQNLKSVQDSLYYYQFNLGSVIVDRNTDTLSGQVYRQYPPPGMSPGARAGSDIDIWLTDPRLNW